MSGLCGWLLWRALRRTPEALRDLPQWKEPPNQSTLSHWHFVIEGTEDIVHDSSVQPSFSLPLPHRSRVHPSSSTGFSHFAPTQVRVTSEMMLQSVSKKAGFSQDKACDCLYTSSIKLWATAAALQMWCQELTANVGMLIWSQLETTTTTDGICYFSNLILPMQITRFSNISFSHLIKASFACSSCVSVPSCYICTIGLHRSSELWKQATTHQASSVRFFFHTKLTDNEKMSSVGFSRFRGQKHYHV